MMPETLGTTSIYRDFVHYLPILGSILRRRAAEEGKLYILPQEIYTVR